MTPEEKELVLKDLCARLPYGVIGEYSWKKREPYNREKTGNLFDELKSSWNSTEDSEFLPYLRPMSSMTEEEKQEMKLTLSPKGTAIFDNDGIHIPMTHTGDFVPYDFMQKVLSFLYERHFDVNGLIPLWDAIEVTEENNPYKE